MVSVGFSDPAEGGEGLGARVDWAAAIPANKTIQIQAVRIFIEGLSLSRLFSNMLAISDASTRAPVSWEADFRAWPTCVCGAIVTEAPGPEHELRRLRKRSCVSESRGVSGLKPDSRQCTYCSGEPLHPITPKAGVLGILARLHPKSSTTPTFSASYGRSLYNKYFSRRSEERRVRKECTYR